MAARGIFCAGRSSTTRPRRRPALGCSSRGGPGGRPGDLLRWALEHARALATPGARLFELAGLGEPPVGVKDARRALRARGAEPLQAAPAHPARNGSGPAVGPAALEMRNAWVELD